MTDLKRPMANPTVVLRDEFDDWAVLFDPDSGEAYGLDPVSVFIWRLFDGKHTPPEILEKLRQTCEDGVPDEAPDDLNAFFEELTSRGLVGYAEAAKQVWQPVWSKMKQQEKRVQSAQLFDNVTRMARVVPAYRLRATLAGEFWKEMEKVCFDNSEEL